MDSLYGIGENCEKAGELSAEVVSLVMGEPQGKALTLTDFNLGQEATVSASPQGRVPTKAKHKKGKHLAGFGLDTCLGCPYLDECTVKPWKKGYYVH